MLPSSAGFIDLLKLGKFLLSFRFILNKIYLVLKIKNN